MVRRRHKLYFEKTTSKLPIIIFSISVLIGGFFLFRIIATLVKENNNTVEIIPVETSVPSTEIEDTDAKIVTKKEGAKQPPDSSKSSVKKTTEKPTVTVQGKQTQSTPISEFYTIQVATFNDKKRAENLVNQLKAKKFSPLYIKTRGKWFEVCVGKFESATKGRETLSKLKKDFPDAFTRKLQSPFEEK